MPRSTQSYPFEWKVLGFASSLSARLVGRPGYDSFLMVLDTDGSVRMLQFERSESSWAQRTAMLDSTGASYLFYDPFDAPEYTWLSWNRIERSTMERLMEESFEDADFVNYRAAASGAGKLERPSAYPTSWGVMF